MVETLFIIVLVGGMVAMGFAIVVQSVMGGRELDELLSTGLRLAGKLVSVDAGVPVGRSNHTRYYKVGIELEVERKDGPERIRTQIVVPETLRQLVQGGAPCVAVVDRRDPKKLCLVSIENAFGVSTPVTLGTMYSRW